MKVFIVFEKWDAYDQDEIIGVYDSRDKADAVYSEASAVRCVIEEEVQ